MTEEHSVDDPDPRTAPKPQPSDKPEGEERDFPHRGPLGEGAPEPAKHSEPPEYAPGEEPHGS